MAAAHAGRRYEVKFGERFAQEIGEHSDVVG